MHLFSHKVSVLKAVFFLHIGSGNLCLCYLRSDYISDHSAKHRKNNRKVEEGKKIENYNSLWNWLAREVLPFTGVQRLILKINRYGEEFLDSVVCLIVLGVLDRLDEGSSLAWVSSHLW